MPLNEHGAVNVKELLRDPITALDAYHHNPGWNMPLHKDIIHHRLNISSAVNCVVYDETFLRNVHKILKSWYGKRSWRIVGFDEFQSEITKKALHLTVIDHLRIESLQDDCNKCYGKSILSARSSTCFADRCCVKCMAEFLWRVILNTNLTDGDAKIISGTKALHHFLPNLLPPMDNKFTGEFFTGKRNSVSSASEARFSDIYSGFVCLARELVKNTEFMDRVGEDFNTSIPKTIDNAIIGFMQLEKKGNKR